MNLLNIILIIASLLGIVLLNPIGDAIRDNGNKRKQKSLELVRDFLFFLIIYLVSNQLSFTICLGLSYWALRLSIHNLSYNIVRKLPWYYTGTTCKADEIEHKYLKDNKILTLCVRLLVFIFAIIVLWKGITLI